MTLCTATFETGVNGANVQTSDPGSATAWSVVTLGTTGAITYSNTQKYQTLSGKFLQGGTAGQSYLTWSSGATGSPTDHFGRAYIYLDVIDTTSNFNLIYFDTPSGVDFLNRDATTGFLSLHDVPDTSTIGTVALPTGSWLRIEWHIIHSATVGQMIARVFVGSNVDGTSPDETITTAANKDTGTQSSQFFAGILSNRSNCDIYMDNIVFGASDWPGPFALAQPSDDPPIGFSGRGAGW